MNGPADAEPKASSLLSMASTSQASASTSQASTSRAPDAPQAQTGTDSSTEPRATVSALSAGVAPLKLAPTTHHSHLGNLASIADASPAASSVELADDPPSAQPIPAPMQQPTPVSPGTGGSTHFGSPVGASHLRSRSPHSPSSPGFAMAATGSSSGSTRRARPASVLVGSAIGVTIPCKPRSNSSLTTNRPAPPSPASSRPQSQVLELSPRGSPPVHGLFGPGAISPPTIARSSPSPVGGRERATSTSSAVSQGRRMRPRSTLGTNVTSARDAGALGTSNSDPSTPYGRRAGSIDARAGPFDIGAAVAEEGSKEEPEQPVPEIPAPSPPTTVAVATIVRRVIVRDFAFPPDDDRFLGLGSHRPRSNWGEGEPEPETPTKTPAASFGFPLGLGSWGFLRRDTDTEEVPDDESRVEDMGNEHDADAYWSDGDDFYDDEYYLDDEEPDGLYRAAYAFEPEGVNEMAVDVGDLLDVRGRGGGGDGWVVAIRLDSGAEGLVPEGYLERADEAEYAAEWVRVRDVRAKLAAVTGDDEGGAGGAEGAAGAGGAGGAGGVEAGEGESELELERERDRARARERDRNNAPRELSASPDSTGENDDDGR